MTKPSQTARKRAETLISQLSSATRIGPIERRQAALAAHRLAREVDDRLLEAEALLQLGCVRSPTMHPDETLASLRHAREVFRANAQHRKASLCQVAIARALYDVGEDRNAIAAAAAALLDTALPASECASAIVVMAKCHGHLGELDEALRLLIDHAVPVSRTAPPGMVQAQAKWALGLTYLDVKVAHEAPALVRTPPTAPPVSEPSPTLETILGLLAEAQAALPTGVPWGYIDISKQLALGLFGAHDEAVATLGALAAAHAARDPLLAGWALYCQASVLLHRGLPQRARDVISQAFELAERVNLTVLIRDLLMHRFRVCEALGDLPGSLAAYKQWSSLQLRGVTLSHWPNGVAPARGNPGVPGLDSTDKTPPTGERRLRNLEPACVRRAVRFIEDQYLQGLDVDKVVAHCEVSRRTLEVAFKEAKATTIAQYIKQRKFEHALKALRYTDLPIQEIAMSIGYLSPASFTREFSVEHGQTPSEWRRTQGLSAHT